MIYFVEQYRLGSGGRKMLELPAGVIDPNEEPIAATVNYEKKPVSPAKH